MTLGRDRGARAKPHHHFARAVLARGGRHLERRRPRASGRPCRFWACASATSASAPRTAARSCRAGRPRARKDIADLARRTSVFAGLPRRCRVARYHSLVIARASLPPSLRVIATADDDGEIMAVEHRKHPVDRRAVPPRVGGHRVRLRDARPLPARRARADRELPTGADGAGQRRMPRRVTQPPVGGAARRCGWRVRAAAGRSGALAPRTSMIIETIVTTVAADGGVNFAPMGVEWGDDAIVLKPFLETATYRNIARHARRGREPHRRRARVRPGGHLEPAVSHRPATVVRGVVLADCCSWRELEVRVDRQHAAALAYRDGGRASRHAPRVHRLQSCEPRGARGGHPRHAAASPAAIVHRERARPAAGDRGQDRRRRTSWRRWRS